MTALQAWKRAVFEIERIRLRSAMWMLMEQYRKYKENAKR